MKNLIIAVLLLCGISASAQIKSATLTASGLTCSMCSKSIYKSLSKVAFIENVDVNVEKSTFMLRFKENAKVSPDEIKKAVEDAGFSVASMHLTVGMNAEVYNDAHVNIGGSTFHFLNVSKKTLSGDHVVTLLDKNFTSAKEHKKFSKYTAMKCYETGTMAACCPKDQVTEKRIYHVTL